MSENKYDFLANLNGFTQERYIDEVNRLGGEKFTPEEENGRLRKAVYCLATIVAVNHPEILNLPIMKELIEYYEHYEEVKRIIKQRMNNE